MASQRERITEELNLHIGERLDTAAIAEKLGISVKKTLELINTYLGHRLQPPTGHERTILPPDGLSDPLSACQARKREVKT